MRFPFFVILAIISLRVGAQTSWEQRKMTAAQSILKEFPARNIGPTVQGGRIVDIDVNQQNPTEFYVGYASGGIFKTINNGITFEPFFDHQDALGIGDFALSQSDPATMYVGTGEKNSSRSSYAGSGIYKTTDGGKTWQHLGLVNTQHISRVLIHPNDNNTVWVAAIGSLYTPNEERGVFKTTDGGKTWKKTLYINDSTGVIDLVINPANPDQLIATAWERSRKAWNFKGNGVSSSIYRSTDGGNAWTKSVAGFPQGPQVGRIGLTAAASKPNVVYAILDNQAEVEDKKTEPKDDGRLQKQLFKTISKDDFLKLDAKKLTDFLRDNGFPKKYDAARVKRDVQENKYAPKALFDWFGENANQNLFNTKIVGAEVYRSDDFGSTWKKMNSYDLDGVYYTYGYYFAEMQVAPDDENLIYIYGVPMLKSRDGGITWHRLDTLRGIRHVHVDHHALWINPKNSKHLLLGNDGGLYQSYDEGANWLHINNMPVGQFYTVNVDMEKPYNVYGGLQDNGVHKGSSRSVNHESAHWEEIHSGDGMYVVPDPRNSNLVYSGYQFGNYDRIETDKGKFVSITPTHDIGEAPLRWNWRTPLIMSKHNPDILYIGAQRVYRTLNQGDDWQAISGDLSKNRTQGNVAFSTITSLAESPLKFGLLYAGTDDGNVWVSKNGGENWEAIVGGLPAEKWVSSIFPSPHDEATVFVSLNGYRNDDFKTYVYLSTDYGKSWKSVKGNLPESVANVIIQDPVNADLLYAGLDVGTFVSVDKGTTWNFFNQMLNVPSYDMLVHPRDNELVVGTHGRSVFVADVKPLQALRNGEVAKSVIAFAPEAVRYQDRWGEKQYGWSKPFEPKVPVQYYIGKAASSVVVQIMDEKKIVVRTASCSGDNGFHTWTWDLKIEEAVAGKSKSKQPVAKTLRYAAKGKYKIRFINGADSSEVEVEIK